MANIRRHLHQLGVMSGALILFGNLAENCAATAVGTVAGGESRGQQQQYFYRHPAFWLGRTVHPFGIPSEQH